MQRVGKLRTTRTREQHIDGAIFYPASPELYEGDVTELIREHILPGHTPSEPMLTEADRVIAFGSCFARELRAALERAGLASDNFWIPDHLTTSFALLDYMSWAVTGDDTGRGFRYDEKLAERDDAAIREHLREAGAFVLTFGLSEVWEDRETGAVLWRGIPRDVFDQKRHSFRVTTVDENVRNIAETVELIRRVNERAPVVLTLSPVPLKATFRGISCITADAVSKSTLRVALDQVLQRGYPDVYYWPSFEVIRWLGAHLSYPAFGGAGAKDQRHVSRDLVKAIIDLFVETFYRPEAQSAFRTEDRETRLG